MIKRPENHIKETRSISYVQKVWAEWSVNKLSQDYGIDLDVTICENGEVTDIKFPAQLKSTDKIKLKNGLISFSIDTEHLNYFFNQSLPFLFVLYDNQNDIAYWLLIQDYIWDNLNEKKPDWRTQQYNTLYIPVENKIEDLNKVKEAIIDAGNRIIQEIWYKLDIRDGLGLKENLEKIEKLKKLENFEEKAELKVKEAKLEMSLLLIHAGDIENANVKLNEIYTQNKQDLMHLKSIIALASQLNIADSVQNEKVINYSKEGIDLAKELKNITAESILILSKNRAIFYKIILKIGKLLYSKQINSQSGYGKLNLLFIDNEFKQLTKMFRELEEELNEALDTLIKNEDYYIAIYFLAGVLDLSAMLISAYKPHNAEIMKVESEIENKMEISKHLLNIIKIFNDPELEIVVKSSVANFYYYSEKPEALNLMKEALEISIEIENKAQISRLNKLVKIIEEKPNPYKIDEDFQENLSTSELQNLIITSLEYQGIDFNSKDEITEAILLGIKDANPEKYHKFCSNIYIVYVTTSPLGRSIALTSLGRKMIYCSEKNVLIVGISLEESFLQFKSQYCENCEMINPRDSNWQCKVGWFEKRRLSTRIQEVLRKLHENQVF
jgi:hypothetical protein